MQLACANCSNRRNIDDTFCELIRRLAVIQSYRVGRCVEDVRVLLLRKFKAADITGAQTDRVIHGKVRRILLKFPGIRVRAVA